MENNSIKAFIEDAIAGGWKASPELSTYEMKVLTIEKMRVTCEYLETCTIDFDVRMPLLDPLAWQAVNKTRRWKYIDEKTWKDEWHEYWLLFIDHLADGKTIDTSLSLL